MKPPTNYYTELSKADIDLWLDASLRQGGGFCVATLGCKTNQWEGDRIETALRRLGLRRAPRNAPAALAVVNGCAVTHTAAAKTRRQLSALLRRAGNVIVTGCLDEAALPDGAQASRLGRMAKPELLETLDQIIKERALQLSTPGAPHLFTRKGSPRTRAFVKIQDGCDAFCSYCIIPYLRPRVASRPIDEICREAAALLDAGHRELVLTGIHLGAYGRVSTAPGAAPEPGVGGGLVELMRRLLELPALERLRLSSIEASEVTPELIDLLAAEPRIARHLHLPLQAGDDGVLRAMNRRYTVAGFLDTAERIRNRIPSIGLTTDILAGFPAETETAFANTLDTCRRAAFSRMHVFPYSPREGTAAYERWRPLAAQEVKARAAQLKALGAELARAFHEGFVGRRLAVMTEHRRDRATGTLAGWSSEYARVAFDGGDALKGRLVEVVARGATSDGLTAEYFGDHRQP